MAQMSNRSGGSRLALSQPQCCLLLLAQSKRRHFSRWQTFPQSRAMTTRLHNLAKSLAMSLNVRARPTRGAIAPPVSISTRGRSFPGCCRWLAAYLAAWLTQSEANSKHRNRNGQSLCCHLHTHKSTDFLNIYIYKRIKKAQLEIFAIKFIPLLLFLLLICWAPKCQRPPSIFGKAALCKFRPNSIGWLVNE